MNFIKTVLASMLGTFLAMIVSTLFFVLLIVAIVSVGGKKAKESIESNSILHLKLDAPIIERARKDKFNFSNGNFNANDGIGLNQIIEDLELAAKDDRIVGIFMEIPTAMAMPSDLSDIRKALIEFKKSGKWILAYSENYTQSGYYISSTADEVYLTPTGEMEWGGLFTELMFFKNMLDKLGIEAQIIRGPDNKYKSAVEPFLYDHMSPENREQIAAFVNDIWKVMLNDISASRGISVELLNSMADSLATRNPSTAVSAGMLTGLKYRDEVIEMLRQKTGRDASVKEEKMNLVSLEEYHDSEGKPSKGGSSKQPRIAVVYAVGEIEGGEGDDQTIGSDRIAKALRDARMDSTVKAIVLRVNSPGGSALASDIIWRETQLIKQSGKPLVVSMGDLAASGGYYISCAADRIYANPNTITGSIGVFGIIPNTQKFFNEKLGITFDTYSTNPHANSMNITQPLDAEQREALEQVIKRIYSDFTSRVAEGRKMPIEKVDSLARGRVWSGEDALANGLVDKMGNLQDAIEGAKELAGLTEYRVKAFPDMIDPFEKLIEQLTGKKETAMLQAIFGEDYKKIEAAQKFIRMRGVQARLPFYLELH